MTNFLSTKAKRKAIAARVSRVASDTLGIDATLAPCNLYPGEFHYRAENLETTRGPLAHLHLEVCPRGICVHIRFKFPQFAPPGANSASGKWNHYLWPRNHETAESYMAAVESELALILSRVKLTGATRADRPGMEDYWEYERERFARRNEGVAV